MRYLHVPTIPVPVSKIALGSSYLGTGIPQKEALKMLDTFAAAEGTAIDTARVYGQLRPKGKSESESLIGQWMHKNKMRDAMVVITKGLFPNLDGSSRFSYQALMDDIKRSQDELQSDTFDLWFLHRDDPAIPVSEIMDMVAPLVQSGVIRTLGASNWTVSRLEEANAYATRNKLPPFAVSEIQWSLANCTPESWGDVTLVCMDQPSLAWYRQQNMPIFAFSSQAKGFFSQAIEQGIEKLSDKSRSRFSNPENLEKIELVRTLSHTLQLSPAAIVTAYITSETPSSVAIVGCSSVAQLQDSLTGANVLLTPEQLAFLHQEDYDAT